MLHEKKNIQHMFSYVQNIQHVFVCTKKTFNICFHMYKKHSTYVFMEKWKHIFITSMVNIRFCAFENTSYVFENNTFAFVKSY